MTQDNLYSVDQDYASGASAPFAPTSGRVGASIPTAQGARCVGYKTPASTIAMANVDANGNLTVVPTSSAGTSLVVTGGATPPALASQAGYLMFGRQDMATPSSYQPMVLDPLGSVHAHLHSKITYHAQISQVAAAANKVLFSIYNGSTAGNVLRIQEISLYITPQSVGGALLGSTAVIYYPVYCQLHRITGHSTQAGSSVVGYVAADLSDSIDPGVTLYSNAAVSGLATQPYHRADANNSGISPTWYARGDVNEKTLVLRPGQGAAVVCISNGTIANGTGTQIAAIDVEATITQAPA